jgi:hypothetical protein
MRSDVTYGTQHTSPGVHPVNRHRRLEQALVCLELLESIGGASGICNDAASLGGSEVFKNAGQLVGSGSGFLYVYTMRTSAGILPSRHPSVVRTVLPHTQGEVCPLQFALLGVVSCLVDGRGLGGVCRSLLQEGVGADRSWRGRVVEKGDDILLSGLMQRKTVSSILLEFYFQRSGATRCEASARRPAIAEFCVAFVAEWERLANTSLNRFLKKLILADLFVS